jgi:hypothetical protein
VHLFEYADFWQALPLWKLIASRSGAPGFASTSAGCAVTIEQDDVIDDSESRRNQFAQPLNASLELEELAAHEAMEMVVMSLAVHLVTRRRARYFHRDQPSSSVKPFIVR